MELIHDMKIITENLKNEFITLLTQTSDTIYIISPYIKSSQVEMLSRYLPEHVHVNILTTFNSESFYQKASDPEFAIILKKNFSNIEIRVNPKLHAKIYLFDRKAAIVTSANFTQSGFDDNIEYSILLKQKDLIKKIANDVKDMFRHSSNLYDILDECKIVREPQIFNRTQEEINTVLNKITTTKFNPQKRSEYQQRELINATSPKGYYIHYEATGTTFVKLGDELTISNDYELKGEVKVIGFRTYNLHFNGLNFEINVKEEGKNNFENKFEVGDEILCEFYRNDEGKWISYKTLYQGLSFIDYTGLEISDSQLVNVIDINGMLLYFDKGALNLIYLKEKGSEAFKAGVKTGFKLMSFDNQELEVDTMFEAYQKLKRYEGRSVKIEAIGSDKRIISFNANFREVKFKQLMLNFINPRTKHKSKLYVVRIGSEIVTQIDIVIKLQSINTFEEWEITGARLKKSMSQS